MKSRWLLTITAIYLLLLTLPVRAYAAYHAFSLKQAQAHVTQGPSISDEVASLGGINIIAGMVYDEANRDLILVGQRMPGQPPATLDDLVVAMRTAILHNAISEVSIDPTLETPKTGRQIVRFSPGIANTQFGLDLVMADIALKDISLKLQSPGIPEVQSYIALAARHRQNRLADDRLAVGSRFVFKPSKDTTLVHREGVFAIRTMNLSVETELLHASLHGKPVADLTSVRDESGDAFSASVNEHIHALCNAHPSFARLRTLFNLVAAAEGIKSIAGPLDLSYWLKKHPVRKVQTPAEHGFHVQRQTYRDQKDRRSFVEVSGGIKLKTIVLSLKAGDVSVLREAVIGSRPDAHALSWTVPIDEWRIPWAKPFLPEDKSNASQHDSSERLGFYLTARSGLVDGASASDALRSVPFEFFVPPTLKLTPPHFNSAPRLPRQDVGPTSGLQSPLMVLAGGGWRPPVPYALPRRDDGLGALHTERLVPSYIEPLQDRPLNWIGNITGSNWIGGNRVGAEFSYAQDRLGEFPLGDPTVPARFYGDRIGRSHDIQYWINTHVPKGIEVSVPAARGQGKEYYTSQGPGGVGLWGSANWAAARDVGLGLLSYALPFGGLLREHVWTANWGHSTPRGVAIPLAQFTSRYPLDDQRRPAFFPPSGGSGGSTHGVSGLGGWSQTGGSYGGLSPLSPTNVGGVYLGGAGAVLKDLGPLKGIAVDEQTGRLVLLSEEHGTIDLPPLRLDDVVTVFRSVYERGEAPFVSIDPDPRDPTGPTLLVRQGDAILDTYVGWILFETDRVMKAFSLGFDNVTRTRVQPNIEGYAHLLNIGFSGNHEEPIWERFWIVPAKVARRRGGRSGLTLFDVPLKVMTQRMELREGKLVPAKDDTPSPEAKAFAEWFTRAYDRIQQERQATPPKGCGVNGPVPVFAELRRFAVITAIAESLRDKGVEFPAWMRDYRAQSCIGPRTTPAILAEATATKTTATQRITQVRRIYGGVNLSPPYKDIHTATADAEAQSLGQVVLNSVKSTPVLSPVTIEKDGKRYQAVTLPGNDTRGLGANRLTETDLVVPVQRGTELRLVRSFHSFFRPNGELGSAWTLDLPRLEQQRRPVRRTQDQTEFHAGFHLTSPLGSYSERFTERKFVPEVQATLLVPGDSGHILGMGKVKDEKIGIPTHVVIFRDGRRWHFDEAGSLAAVEEAPLTVVYRRDQMNRARRIEGWYGKVLRAEIQLDYDDQGRLVAARGSNARPVKYTYDATGALTGVAAPEGAVEYEYRDGQVTAILRGGKRVQTFQYDERGQLTEARDADGTAVRYEVTRMSDGVQVTALTADRQETVLYDPALRPLYQVLQEGTHIRSHYAKDGTREQRVLLPNDEEIVVQRSPDALRETFHVSSGAVYSLEYDAAGRVTRLRQGKRDVLRQDWDADGRLAKIAYETAVVHPEYREDGVLTGVFITPVDEESPYRHWLRITFDELGRSAGVMDYTGSKIEIGYNGLSNEPQMIVIYGTGLEVKRNRDGRIETLHTSWGERQNNVFDPETGQLNQVEFARGDATSLIEFARGKPIKVRQFDGGEMRISYYDRDVPPGKIKAIRTPDDLVITYKYDNADRMAAINYAKKYRVEYTYDEQGRVTGVVQMVANDDEKGRAR